MIKQSLSVYHPQDPLERSIQNYYFRHNDRYLTSFECQAAGRALASLKDNEWMNEEHLYDIRADHLTAPEMVGSGEEVVFVTHLIFLRDIIENEKISSQLHDPVVFVSKPIAFYLLKEYPLHVIVKLKALKMSECIQVGGIYVFEETIDLPIDAIVGIKINDLSKKEKTETIIKQILIESRLTMNKAAVSLIENGIFKSDNDDLNVRANDRVQNKITKKNGTIYSVEPEITGMVTVLYEDGDSVTLDKGDFVRSFIYNVGAKN